MVASAEVVRICDRIVYCPPGSALDQGNLPRIALLLLIVYGVLAMALIHFAGLEKEHPRVITDTNVAFELEPPKIEPRPEPPKPEDTSKLDRSNGGARPAAAPAARIASPAAVDAQKVTDQNNATASPMDALNQLNKPTAAEIAEQKPTALAALPTSSPNSPPSPMAAAENTAQTSGAAAGGNPNGSGTGTGTDGTGGHGTGTAGNGTGSGAPGEGGPDRLQAGTQARLGNIAPYRRDMLVRISQNWHPQHRNESLILLIKLNHDGSVVSSEVFQSAGDKDSDEAALAAIASTSFAPLPDWYEGKTLQFKVSMDKVERLQNN